MVVVNNLFFNHSFNLSPEGENIDLADSQNRTPDSKFRALSSHPLDGGVWYFLTFGPFTGASAGGIVRRGTSFGCVCVRVRVCVGVRAISALSGSRLQRGGGSIERQTPLVFVRSCMGGYPLQGAPRNGHFDAMGVPLQ